MFAQSPCCYFTFFRCNAFINLSLACRRFVIIQHFCLTCYNTCHIVKNVCQMLRIAALVLFKDGILIPTLLKTVQLCPNCLRQDSITLSLTQYNGSNFSKKICALSVLNIRDIVLKVLLQAWKLLKDGFS
jgi:hypothetical protein